METHPSRGRAIARAATKPAKEISPSDPLGLLYIPLFNRWNAHNITARELSVLAKKSRHNCHEFHKTTFLENRWEARKQDTLWYHTKRPSFCIAYIPQHNTDPDAELQYTSSFFFTYVIATCIYLSIDRGLLQVYNKHLFMPSNSGSMEYSQRLELFVANWGTEGDENVLSSCSLQLIKTIDKMFWQRMKKNISSSLV